MNTVSDIHENGNDTLTLCFKVPLILQIKMHSATYDPSTFNVIYCCC